MLLSAAVALPPMRIVFFGTPLFAVPSLERLLSSPDIDVVGVVTQPDKRRGRGNQVQPSPVKAIALTHNLPVWQPSRLKRHQPTLEALQTLNADFFIVVAYGQLLSTTLLEMPRLGCINGHGSLLPKYRGAAPIQWCLYHGETITGITTMQMDAGMDTGPMLLKAEVPIQLLDTAQDLAPTLASLTADLLVETIRQLDAQTLHPTPQDPNQATYASLLQKSDFCLDWTRGAIALHNQVRAFAPNCVARLRGLETKIMASAPLGPTYWSQLPEDYRSIATQWNSGADWANQPDTKPGTVVHLAKGLGPVVKTGDGFLLLRHLQLPGKRPQSGGDFANGTRLEIGEIFEPGI